MLAALGRYSKASTACADSNDGALNRDGFGCDHSSMVSPGLAGCLPEAGDDDDFSAAVMCCACGGGVPAGSHAPAELAEFYFSIFDIDQAKNAWKSHTRGGNERIVVTGFAEYALSSPAYRPRVDVVDSSADACGCVDPSPCLAHVDDDRSNDRCTPTTWCAGCCAEGTCPDDVSCFGYVPGGAFYQGTCCGGGTFHCGDGTHKAALFKSQNAKGVVNPSDPEQLTAQQKQAWPAARTHAMGCYVREMQAVQAWAIWCVHLLRCTRQYDGQVWATAISSARGVTA